MRSRATQKAREDISRLDQTMRLENHARLQADLDAEQQHVVGGTMSGLPRGLWDEQKKDRA